MKRTTNKLTAPRVQDSNEDGQIHKLYEVMESKRIEDLPWVLQLTDSNDPWIKSTAVEAASALIGFARDIVCTKTNDLLRLDDSNRRSEALRIIGDLKCHRFRKDVEKLLICDEESFVRAEAAETLIEIGSKESIPPLVSALQDEDATVRGYSAYALGFLGGEAEATLLESILVDEAVFDAKLNMYVSCLRLGREYHLESLIEMLRSVDNDFVWNAMNIFQTLILDDPVPLVCRYKKELTGIFYEYIKRDDVYKSQADAIIQGIQNIADNFVARASTPEGHS